jgi:DNA-3-methyladenine glycosylase I
VEEPERIQPKDASDYFEVMTKAVFQSGMSWKVIEAKWPGFVAAFAAFDPARVAEYSPDDVDRLAQDTGIVRNRRKIEATVENAARILELEQEHGSFKQYLRSLHGFEAKWKSLKDEFKFVGGFGAYYFLFVVGEEVPPHDTFREQMLG